MKSRKIKIIAFVGLMLLAVGIGLGLAAFTHHRAAPPQPTEVVEITAPQMPCRPKDWRLVLVNPWNPIVQMEEPVLMEFEDGQAVDERCYPELMQMMEDCEAAGYNAFICSSYRSQDLQQTLFENKIQRLIEEGCAPDTAPQEAGKVVARPGTSEHQLGLAVDIMDEGHPYLDEAQADMPAQRWLMAHSWEYGFILRYPAEKSELTGIIYEPWHYRYVGKEHAKAMHELDFCMEEYLDYLTR